MIQAAVKRGATALALGLALAFSFSDSMSPRRAVASPYGQEAPNQPAEQTMEQKYKNIQALKGLPAAQMRPMMNYISMTLGVTCANCHVKTGDQWEFDKDDNNHKKTARKMIQMTMDLNKQYFMGRTQVTCMTCHQGHDHPVSVPIFPVEAPKEAARPTTPFPVPKDILAKYWESVGGKDAVEKIKTRVIKGSSVAANGQSFPLEISYTAPDKYTLSVALPQGATTQKLNGGAGWVKNAREDRAMDSVDMMRATSLAMSLEPLQLKDPNARLTFGGFEKIGDRETVILRLTLPDKRRV